MRSSDVTDLSNGPAPYPARSRMPADRSGSSALPRERRPGAVVAKEWRFASWRSAPWRSASWRLAAAGDGAGESALRSALRRANPRWRRPLRSAAVPLRARDRSPRPSRLLGLRPDPTACRYPGALRRRLDWARQSRPAKPRPAPAAWRYRRHWWPWRSPCLTGMPPAPAWPALAQEPVLAVPALRRRRLPFAEPNRRRVKGPPALMQRLQRPARRSARESRRRIAAQWPAAALAAF